MSERAARKEAEENGMTANETGEFSSDFGSSTERSGAMSTFWRLAGLGSVAVLVSVLIWFYGNFFYFTDRRAGSWASLLTALVGAWLLIRARIVISDAKAQFDRRVQRRAASRVQHAIEELDPTELKTIIKFNREQMDQYHALTKAQAADAYQRAQTAMFVGFAVLVIGSLVTLGRSNATNAETYASGALTALGTLLSGFIGKTFLNVYRNSLLQLNYFFEQPLVSSYLITAERLAAKVSKPKRDDALLRIVDRILAATVSRSNVPDIQLEAATPAATPAPPAPPESVVGVKPSEGTADGS